MQDFDAAIADYTEAIRLQPEFEEAYYNRGVAHAHTNAYKSVNFQEPAPWGDQSHWRATIADLSVAIAYRPDRADSYRYRGFAHNGVGENEEAIADLNEAVRLNSKDGWAHVGLADVYEMRGDFDKAEREYDIAARLEKQNVDVFVHRSTFYWRRQNFEQALTEANKAVQLAPNYPPARFARATANQFLKRYDLAVSDLTSAIEFDTKAINPLPGWTTSLRQPSQLAAEYDCRGMVYESTGDHERAIADHEEAICLDPEKASTWLNLADVYQHQGKFEDAKSCYNQAIRLKPDKPLCWRGLAKLFKQTGQCEMAMAALSVVWNPGEPNVMALLLRAEIYRCLGDSQRAISDYDEATRLDPTDAQIWLDAVRLSKDKERIERALAATAKIVEAHPGNLEAWFVRAELFWLQGTNNQAIGELSEVVQQHPENAEVYIRRAQAY